ncbi:hypothetical protein [Nostoc sp.]|uniref:hypothetical protein n=1 Tax=Nostoc sp. TaxID=1180 RepID=UPI002FF999F4
MSCTTTVHGSGLNGGNGASLGNYGDYTFTGRVTFAATTFNGFAGLQMYIDGVSQGTGYIFYTDAYILYTTCEPLQIEYDCINGACTAKTTYSTPGLYKSLGACEIACGTGCSGKCLSNADWAQIENLSSQIMNKNCS